MNRAVRAATTGALLVTPLVLGACSAGQVTQTWTQERDKVGGGAEVEGIRIRALELATPPDGNLEVGDDVVLQGALVNTEAAPERLVSIRSEEFEGVRVIGGDPETVTASTGAEFSDEVALELLTDDQIYFGKGDDPTVILENLLVPLTPGQAVTMIFEFESGFEVAVPALVDTPDDVEERENRPVFDFHHGEEVGGEDPSEAGLPLEGEAEAGGDSEADGE